jgi:hypothetical protein
LIKLIELIGFLLKIGKRIKVKGQRLKVQGSPVKFAALHIFDIFNGASKVQAKVQGSRFKVQGSKLKILGTRY